MHRHVRQHLPASYLTQTKLIITSNTTRCRRREPAGWHCVLLPRRLRLFHMSTRPGVKAGAFFQVYNWAEVVIEDVTIDLLPNPNLAQMEALDALGDPALALMRALRWDTLIPEEDGLVDVGSVQKIVAGTYAYPVFSGLQTDEERWNAYMSTYDMYKRVQAGGAGTSGGVFDVQNVDKLLLRHGRAGFGNAVGASSVRSTLVANNYHTGVSAKRLLDFGLPLQNETKGLVALQSAALSSRGLTMERAYLSHGFFGTANAMNVYAMATLGTDPCIYYPIYPDPSPPPSPPAPPPMCMSYVRLGYCEVGYYAGWDASIATTELCHAQCLSEPECMFASLNEGSLAPVTMTQRGNARQVGRLTTSCTTRPFVLRLLQCRLSHRPPRRQRARSRSHVMPPGGGGRPMRRTAGAFTRRPRVPVACDVLKSSY